MSGQRLISTVVRVISVEQAGEGAEHQVRAWIVAAGWSVRRAFLAPGDDLLRVWLAEQKMSAKVIEELFDRSVISRKMLPGYAKMITDQRFIVDLVAPSAVAEPGERIEMTGIEVAPSAEDVEAWFAALERRAP